MGGRDTHNMPGNNRGFKTGGHNSVIILSSHAHFFGA